jgi:hypothetical protein
LQGGQEWRWRRSLMNQPAPEAPMVEK